MGAGSYTIPMNEYYNKSKSLKEKVSTLAEDVQTNFIQKVSSSIGELDGQDQSFLEGCSAYTSTKTLYTKLTETHKKNLTNMSSFNGQNPLYKIEHTDKEFASKFNEIANGTNNSDVTYRLSLLNNQIALKVEEKQFTDFLSGISKFLSKDEVQRLMKMAKLDPKKAWTTLLNSNTFLEAIQKNPTIENAFLNLMLRAETAGNIPRDLMNALVNSDKFIDYLSNRPKIQNVVLNAMATISDKGWKIITVSEKFVSWVKTISELAPIKVITKFFGSKLGKAIASPWTAAGISGAASGMNAYWSEGNTKGDVAKSISTGTIDAITSIGPIDGAILGAQIGGAWGAVAGGLGGLVMWGTQVIWPGWPKIAKNWANDKIDDIREWGQSAKQGFGDIKDTLGNMIKGKPVNNDPLGIKNQMKDTAEKIIDWLPKFEQPKANWFGG